MLKRFAQMMKWPNLRDTLDTLYQRADDDSLDSISSDSMAFFSGLVLPGPTFPFLLMNSLIDVDPDRATDDLALLSHMQPHCGFQYRNSYTYWSSTSIVGKVLAPTCHDVGGWVGPARPSADLGRSQIARIRSRRCRQRVSAADVASMSQRSDPLGPPAELYPVKEYALIPVDPDETIDTVRIELLTFRPVGEGTGSRVASGATDRKASGGSVTQPSTSKGIGGPASDSAPRWYDALVQFAIDGVSYPIRLAYDVSFVSAWPCSDGPHPLFFDYVFSRVRVDQILEIRDWGGAAARLQRQYYGNLRSAGQSRATTTGLGGGGGLSARSSPAPPLPGAAGAAAASSSSAVTPDKGKDPVLPKTSQATSLGGGAGGGGSVGTGGGVDDDDDDEKVLLIECFGVPDNEVLARAWCAQYGLSAIVADLKRTWCVLPSLQRTLSSTRLLIH